MNEKKNRFRASAENFSKIPGSPIAYWVGKKVFDADVKALLEADVVVAIDYGLYSDTGTAWEIGLACGACIPIITLVPDETIPAQHSLMVCSSSKIFCSIKRFCNELTIQTFKEFLETGNQYNLLGVELK